LITHSLTHSFTLSLTHSLFHSLTHSLTHSLIHSLTLTHSLTHSSRTKPYVENADGSTADADMDDDFDVNDYIKKFDFNKKIIDVEEEK